MRIRESVPGIIMNSRNEKMDVQDWPTLAARMVETQIAARGGRDPDVLAAMRTIPRHQFVPDTGLEHAYADHPIEIGLKQTISQPYIVAFMTELLRVSRDSRVLEV